MTTTDFIVRRDALATARIRVLDDTPLDNGQVRVRLRHFALTSNNITYGAFGDMLGYWQFFPTGEDGWGRIPVWGFADVVQSRHPGVKVGERLYGYFPMASHAVLSPERLSAAAFSDGAPHRASLHPVYNQYMRTGADPFYSPGTEGQQALLRPLFFTSWLLDDFLADNQFFGATTLLLSSASSKTAYGTAFQLAQRQGMQVVGLTSPANVAFCEELGCYSRVLTYDQLEQLPADTAAVYVDFAGNAAFRQAVHARFANLRYSSSIGGTHVDRLGGAQGLAGPRPVLFFAPDQIRKRQTDWGTGGLQARLVRGWQAFVQRVNEPAGPWLEVRHHHGPEAVMAAYAQVLGGKGDPRVGHMLGL